MIYPQLSYQIFMFLHVDFSLHGLSITARVPVHLRSYLVIAEISVFLLHALKLPVLPNQCHYSAIFMCRYELVLKTQHSYCARNGVELKLLICAKRESNKAGSHMELNPGHPTV